MLRPFPYWKETTGDTVRIVWCGGNPILWWEVLPALAMMTERGWRARDMPRIFLGIAYLAYVLMWLPIPRYLLSYDYMPALYIGVLALGDELARTWRGESSRLECLFLLVPLEVGIFFGWSHNLIAAIGAGILIGCLLAVGNRDYRGRIVCVLVTAATIVSFLYFFPLWTAMPLPASSYNARMWFKGPGLANWQ